MVKDDRELLEQAELHLAYLGEANRQAQALPPWLIRQIEDRSDPDTEIATLIALSALLSKGARRHLEDVQTGCVNLARERVSQTGDQPALQLVRSGSQSRRKKRWRSVWSVATLFRKF